MSQGKRLGGWKKRSDPRFFADLKKKIQAPTIEPGINPHTQKFLEVQKKWAEIRRLERELVQAPEPKTIPETIPKQMRPLTTRTMHRIRKTVNTTDWADVQVTGQRMMKAHQEMSSLLASLHWRRCKFCRYWFDRQACKENGKTICPGCQAPNSFILMVR